MIKLVPGHSLAVFRFCFGLIVFVHAVSFMTGGMARFVYIDPQILFPFIGFEWLPRLSADNVFRLHQLMAIAGLMIAFGFLFRLSLLLFLLPFIYLFLIEETYYQNHHYLLILFGVLLLFTEAGRVLSVDAWLKGLKSTLVPETDYFILRFQIAVVYFFAAIAKINPDWLRGEPMREWLTRRGLGEYALAMSYGGLLYDLLIIPALLWRKTRYFALAASVLFHATNQKLFSIGIFPWMAMSATLLFLDYDWPTKTAPATQTRPAKKWFTVFIILWCSVQVLLPLRHWLYPGRVAWNLDGFYFSWMMKLNTRLGAGVFYVDTDQGRQTVDPDEQLSPMQAAAARTNPNEMVKYSRYLRQQFEAKGLRVDRVTNDVKIRLNDRPEKPFADPDVDLSRVPYGIFTPNSWVLDP